METRPKIILMDTTLRDGEQTQGMSFTPAEKTNLAKALLNKLKVDRIEIASARVSSGEMEGVQRTTSWAEEKGFLGGSLVLLLFAVIVGNGIRIAAIARDRFGMLLAAGATVIFMIHIFINIGMTLGITPITGLPLPLLSYGGSFVISCCVLQGLLQSIYRFRKDFS